LSTLMEILTRNYILNKLTCGDIPRCTHNVNI